MVLSLLALLLYSCRGDLDLSRLNLVKTLGLWRGLQERLGLLGDIVLDSEYANSCTLVFFFRASPKPDELSSFLDLRLLLVLEEKTWQPASFRPLLMSSGFVIPCTNPEILMHYGAPLTFPLSDLYLCMKYSVDSPSLCLMLWSTMGSLMHFFC
ncbi:hypothetical protein Tco_0828210 [Tanacetum coccineum]